MTLVAIGILVAMLAQWASEHLVGNTHPADRVAGLSWFDALRRLPADPLDVLYGVPAGLLFGGWGVIAAVLLSTAYEVWECYKVWEWRNGLTPDYIEVEDVRDVTVGALLGWLARVIFSP